MNLDVNLVPPTLIVSLLWYAGITFLALRQREHHGDEVDWLALYGASTGLWSLIQFGALWGWFAPPTADVADRVPLYAALVLGGLLLQLTRNFLRLSGPGWSWWAVLGGWLAAGLALELNLLNLPATLIAGDGWSLDRNGAVIGALMAGWGVMIGGATWLTLAAQRRAQQPLHRNRIAYWAPVLVLSALGDGLLFAQRIVLGTGLYMLATGLAAYAMLEHRLPDVRQASRQVLAYCLTIALIAAGFGGALSLAQGLLAPAPGPGLIVAGTLLALIAAVLFEPLLRAAQRLVNRVIVRADYDPARTVREYSISISNILDVGQLARVSLGLIRDGLGAQHGLLFLVDRKRDADGEHFELRNAGELRPGLPASGQLAVDSPVADYLVREFRPLTQFDVDLLPRFRELVPAERQWLASLDMDVYVPIYSKGAWLGLFALGPKVSGDRYYDEDLLLLSTLADQTTVALENARLVDNLMQLNRTLREAYGQLDLAKNQLEQLDRAKSDFIAVLSHELRTPMGILLGYSQMLADDPEFKARPMYQSIIDGLSKGAVRLQEIIETMLDMALIDNQAMRLYHKPVPILPMLQAVQSRFVAALEQRRQTLALDSSLADLPKIEGDMETLGKVFHHLIGNAIKYTPDGGRITLSGRVLPDNNPRLGRGGVEIVVADTGIGIDPRFKDLIFTKFYQTGEVALHSSGKTKFKGGGPGLGLAIARGIVDAHGGKMWVESPGYDEQKCPGSQFFVALPLRQPETLTIT